MSTLDSVLLWAFLLGISAVLASNDVLSHTTVHVEQFSVSSPLWAPKDTSERVHRYEVAFFTQYFNRPVTIRRDTSVCAGIDSYSCRRENNFWNVFPSGRTDGHGLYRLTCGSDMYESYPYIPMKSSTPKDVVAELPSYLVPVVPDLSAPSDTSTSNPEHPLLDILRAHVAFEDDSQFFATPSAAGVTKLVHALVTRAHTPAANAAASHALPESLFPLSRLSSCRLASLPPSRQTLSPAASLAAAEGPLPPLVVDFAGAKPCPDTDSLLASARHLLLRQGLLAEAPRLAAALRSPADAAMLLPDHPALARAQARAGRVPTCADFTDAHAPASAFLETSSSASASASAAARLQASLGSIVETTLSPLVPQATNVINGVFGTLLQTQFAYSLVPSLTETISKDLMRMIPAHLKLSVPSAVAEIVKDQLPGPVARAVAERVTWAVANKLTAHLVQHVTPVVADVAVRKLAMTVPGKVAHLANRQLAPMLTKALTHAVVPALSETLAHSPLRMSWCEACRERGKLCQYCWQNPTQNHAAMHYAGYFSTYYADYYSRYFDGALQQRRAEAHRRALDLELVRNRYELVRDVEVD